MPKKTNKNDGDVTAFLMTVENETKRNDSFALVEMMREITGDEPTMFGTSIIGFGKHQYQTADGKTHDWFMVGFSPRKANLALYGLTVYEGYEAVMQQLGKYKTGKSCLYVNKLADVDEDVLRELIQRNVDHLSQP